MTLQEFETYLTEHHKHHIIFDLDWTLVRLLINWDNWHHDMSKLFKSYEPHHEFDNYGAILQAETSFPKKYGQDVVEKMIEINYRNEKKYMTGYELIATTHPLINTAKKHAQIYLWTSNDRRTITPVLQELKIENEFTKIVTRNDVQSIKPDPNGYYIINDQSIPAAQFLMIGDSEADKGAAQAAGIDFIDIIRFDPI